MQRLLSRKRYVTGAALVVLAILLTAAPVCATVIWSDDCESFTNWPTWSGKSQPTLSSSPDPIQSGSHAFKFNNASNRVYHVLSSTPTTNAAFACRFWLYDDGQNLASTIADIRNSGSSVLLGVGTYNQAGSYDSSTYQVRILPQPSGSDTQGWLNMSGVTRSNGWHRFDIYCNNSTGAASFYVDGTLGLSGYSTTSGTTFSQVVVGAGVSASAYTTTQTIDTVAVLQNPTKVTFATSGSGSIGVSVSGTVFSKPNGYYDTGETLALTAAPSAGYRFQGWSSSAGWSSPDATVSYTPEAGNPTVTATFVHGAYQCTTTACPSAGGSVTGGDWYDANASVTVQATANPGYSFSYWTDDSCSGTHVVSSNPTFSFSMPSGSVSLFAHFVPGTYTLTRSACAGGSVSGSCGSVQYGTQVTVTATPDPGYWFSGWSMGTCGGTVVSRNSTYTFTMPSNDCDLHANFIRPEIVETFEDYNTGGDSFESLDKNDPAGPNQASNGLGNPWWGTVPPNGRIDVSKAHSGTKSLWGTAGGCRDFYNLQYRCNNGLPFTGSVYLDWWFYDPLGSGGSTTNFCGDYTALSCYSGMPTTLDHPATVPNVMPAPIQQLAVGMSDDLASGYNPAKYQVRIVGDSGGYHGGWFNTTVTRSVGWHHARVAVGPRKSPSNTNDITFFIDDMASPVMPSRDSITTAGFNMIEVNSSMPQAGTITSSSGAVYSKYYHFASVDDISFGTAPGAPTAAAASNVGPNAITWNWIDGSAEEDGFRIWDAASGGTMKTSVGANFTAWTEAGLSANTYYSRWVESQVSRYAGVILSPRSGLPMTCTLAVAPVYASSGAGAVTCNRGASDSNPYPVDTSTVFTAVNGFASGPTKASKYLYFWDTTPGEPAGWTGASQWTSGALSKAPAQAGHYYLHLRACNQDGVANSTTLNLGPYVYQTPAAVARIADAWAYDDGQMLSLNGKAVTAAFAADSLWIEESDRTAGMRVAYSSATGALQDHLVAIIGVLDSTQKPRTLVASSVEDLGPASPAITPLEMVLRGIGGTGFNAKTAGTAGAAGLYNVGLLVKVAGRISFADNSNPNSRFFYVNDGSSLAASDGSGHAGVKVKCGTFAAPTSGMVKVTGVVSVEPSPNGLVPALIIRSGADVVPVQ